jgi:hypothetical protein
MTTRLLHFNALLAACWAHDRRGFDSELIIIPLYKPLLSDSILRLIPRDFDLVRINGE